MVPLSQGSVIDRWRQRNRPPVLIISVNRSDTVLLDIGLLVAAYLLGAISWGKLFGKMCGVDLLQVGSGSTGGTNALRAMGPVIGLIVGLLDCGKGVAAVWLARQFATAEWVAFAAGLIVVVGHNYSIFLKFKGGKGIATTAGVYLVLTPLALACAIPVSLLAIFLTRYVSLGSLIFVAQMPLFILTINPQSGIIVLAVLLAVMAFIRHSGNIKRLVGGNERRLGEKA